MVGHDVVDVVVLFVIQETLGLLGAVAEHKGHAVAALFEPQVVMFIQPFGHVLVQGHPGLGGFLLEGVQLAVFDFSQGEFLLEAVLQLHGQAAVFVPFEGGQVFVRQVDPLPLTIAGLTLEVAVGG